MVIHAEVEFRTWLERHEGVAGRSVGDICSRLRRASKLLNKPAKDLTVDDISRMEGLDEFAECSVNVRSQLRRSIKLYLKFNGQ